MLLEGVGFYYFVLLCFILRFLWLYERALTFAFYLSCRQMAHAAD